MGTDRVSPARDSPIRVETVYESESTRVTRLFLPGRTVIRKEPLGPDWETRLRHEVGILARLHGVAGVAQVADVPPYPRSIMFDDVAGVSLAEVPMPLEHRELIRLAVDLSGAVARMHGRGVMHLDLGPANVLLCGPERSACLVDFALASSFAEIRPEFTHHSEIVGTLAYLAPELTGRTSRPVDQRADLYALGATLYELATGSPPFGSGDALRLTHDHLARVPVAPAQVNPAVPAELSQIIMHLLEKEPDRRYQTADGLIHDLVQVRDDPSPAGQFRLGDHDFPLRLLPPSRLVGRDNEIARLAAAFAETVSGQSRSVLVYGPPGVGKTSLIDELRPAVTGADGWFVTGKFDQYRRDHESDGVLQAFRSLGRQLLAEPEDELAELRQRLLRGLGPNAGLVTAVVPEFAVLLDVAPDPGDPLTAQVRGQQIAVETLRAVVSRKRPMVFVVDDLQWAGRTPLSIIDMLWGQDNLIDGLLLVGAYRESDVDAAHPLTAMLARWRRQQTMPEQIRLTNLPAASQNTIVADMLRLDAGKAAGLAQALAPHTNGNPYDTVELLNALRHHDVLTPRTGRWQWDQAALSRYLATTDVSDLLAERTDAMPGPARAMLQAMACLGGQAELSLLAAATGAPAATVEQQLIPALDDGLLLLGARETIRFRHDRIQEAILRRLGPQRQHRLQLAMARRLATVPDLYAVAAQQYLPALDAIHDTDERHLVAGLLRHAVEQAKLVANHLEVEKLLTGALRLTDPTQRTTLIELHTGRHAALYGLGRLDEADEVYATIDTLCTSTLEHVDSTLVQVSSLINRNRSQQALDLGLAVLQQLGIVVPTSQELPGQVERALDALHQWLDQSDETDDLHRPEITDATLLATAALIYQILPAAYFVDQTMATMAWLALQALRILKEHGPGSTLIGPAAMVVVATIAMRQDYRTGYRAGRRILTLGEARGYEPGTSQARFMFVVISQWFEPLEDSAKLGQLTRDGLTLGGDLAYASYMSQIYVPQLLDCTPSLDGYATTVESALAFAKRTGNEQVRELLEIYRWLVGLLRGDDGASASDDVASPRRYPNNQSAVVHAHVNRALAASLFGDQTALAEHTTAVMPLLPAIVGTYPTAVAHVLRALALAGRIRATPGDEHIALLAELDEVIDWLAARATDAPFNFMQLLRLAEAERAWAVGDFRVALRAFDAAQREASARQRPWHRALIFERAAQFHLADGMDHTAYGLLAEARHEYEMWGATAKVDDLDWAYPALQKSPPDAPATARNQPGDGAARRRSAVMTGTINLLGVLSASRALSSQTTVDGLRTRVVDVLSAMTGATDVHLLLYSDDRKDWLLTTPGTTGDGDGDGSIPLDTAARQRMIPISVIRYAERIREPLVANDAERDDRFARDPYFRDLQRCSLLAVPILSRGKLRALLLLENRLIHNAFSTQRLDGVMLIAGQLAVSLDNAMVYSSLERKVAERTDQLALANARLELLSITDPLTGVANRRRLEEVLTAEWNMGQDRSGAPVVLAMIDIDHFKLYNDHYGHASGDRCLQRVAHQLTRAADTTDLVARYGGEEFAVVMPDTDIATGLRKAERIRNAVMELAEPHTLTAAEIVTVSIGIAAVTPAPDNTAEELIEMADVELYRAKRSGRNQVRAAPHRAPE
ncbi:diguanylate cyclase (GGDEF)-like protein [Hamadaea flava]|uniref:Diguanylate cyclase n=1 Tax=Hamadaea flava TaxID=1742688 RepID=A0ABV8LQT3_9ACTN|nr:diguanylate cyclase [Hamadaea flava]MCP2322249.1 diguanylate cyclase (GGDEF)-like protein [Hamadaea flava]